MKKFISSIVLFIFTIVSASDLPLMHFDFSKASETECYDNSGLFKCISNNGPFKIEYNALRGYPDSDVIVEDNGKFPPIRNEFTVSSWVLLRNMTRFHTIVSKGNRSVIPEKLQFCFDLCSGYPEFKFMNSSGTWCGLMIYGVEDKPGNYSVNIEIPPVKKGKWTHLAATFKNGIIKIFMDGKLKAEYNSGSPSLVPNEFPLMIGAGVAGRSSRPSYNLDGLINDLSLYEKALDSNEIEKIYESEKQKYTGKTVLLEAIYPEGYDPEFKNKLKIVKDYEKNLPRRKESKNVTSEVRTVNGSNNLFIDGKAVYAMQMMPSPRVKNDGTFNSCRDFAAAGVNLYSDIIYTASDELSWWKGEGVYDFKMVDEKLMSIVKANPEALILIRIKLEVPKWWAEKYPDELAVYSKYGKLGVAEGCASLASEIWEASYEKMLRDFIRHVEASSYASNIYGYSPAGGYSSEWYWYGQHSGFIDYGKAAQNRFRKYIKEKYNGDTAALCAAWNNDKLDFENIEIPSPEFRKKTENGIFRNPVTARPVIDYRIFLNEIISYNIIRSCRICKEETDGKKTTCVFYGYSIGYEGSESMANNGLHGLSKVLDSPYVDMICSPTNYRTRNGGDDGSFMSAYNGSYRQNGKFYWDEADIRTHFYQLKEAGRTSGMKETISVLQRAFGYTLTKGTGMWWFLLVGNATFHHDNIMESIQHMNKLGEETLGCDKSSSAKIALIADEKSMLFSRMGHNQYIRNIMWETYCDAARMGTPFDVYLFDDVLKESFPKYKVYIFMNCFYNGNERIKKAAEKLAKDNAVLVWCYAPGYIGDKGFSTEKMKEITGINLRQEIIKKPVTVSISDNENPITAQMKNVPVLPVDVNPFFYVDDPEASPLIVSGKNTVMGVKKFDGYSSVYTIVPLTKELLQGLCDYAGIHVYSRSFDVFSANKSFIMLHNSTNGKKAVSLPGKYDVTELLSGREIGKGITEFTDDFPEQTTRIYKLSEPDAKSFFSRVFGID